MFGDTGGEAVGGVISKGHRPTALHPDPPPPTSQHARLSGQMLVPKFTEAEARRQVWDTPRVGTLHIQPQNSTCQSCTLATCIATRPRGLPVPHRQGHPQNAQCVLSWRTLWTVGSWRPPRLPLKAVGSQCVLSRCSPRKKSRVLPWQVSQVGFFTPFLNVY